MSAPSNRRAADLFATAFGAAPDAVAEAPGRVNLIGEHTDYNQGLVLPIALEQTTAVAGSVADPAAGDLGPGAIVLVSEIAGKDARETVERDVEGAAQGHWSDYAVGCLAVMGHDLGMEVPGLRLAIATDVPIGAGLSSSAALEVAVLRLARRLIPTLAPALDGDRIARLAQRAENDYVGMPCGIMDQMASSLAGPDQALFLDTRWLRHEAVAIPPDARFAVIHSGVAHQLVDSGYRERVAECAQARAALGVPSLRDLDETDAERIDRLPEPYASRARHQVSENARVRAAVEALRAGDLDAMGRLMTQSHASQRDDYAVSVPEIDRLVVEAQRAGALGARLTGGGFGGSIIALTTAEQAAGFAQSMAKAAPSASLLAWIGGPV